MEKNLLNEIKKFKLLSNYDNNKTLTENYSRIISEDGLTRDVLKVTKELESAKTELKSAMAADKTLLKGGVTDARGMTLTSAEDIITALKDGKLSGKELGKVNQALFKSTNSVAIKNAIAKDIALSDKFLSKYGKLSEKDAANTLIDRGYSKEEAKMITKEYKNSGKSFGGEVSKVGKESGNVNKNINKINFKPTIEIRVDSATGKQIIRNGETVTEVGKTREYNCVTRPNCKKQIKIEELPTTKTVDDLEAMKESLHQVSVKTATSRANWGTAVKWAVGLGLTGGLLWWYFATSGDKVPDDLPVTPPPPSPPPSPAPVKARYRNCPSPGPYTQGCKSESIKPVQTCLGLVPDGKFWVKTQAALVAKGFSNGFTDADVSKICGGTIPPAPAPAPAPNPDETIDTSQDLVTDQGV